MTRYLITKTFIMAKKKTTILSFFEESESKWIPGECFELSAKELEAVTECTIKKYDGEYGTFYKLYLSVEIGGKLLTLKGDKDSQGKKRNGVKLDDKSRRRFSFPDGETEMDIDPSLVKLYTLTNEETGEVITRVRIKKS